MQQEVLSDWLAQSQPGDSQIALDALEKGIHWLYSQVRYQPPCLVAVLSSPLAAHVAVELLATRVEHRKLETDWAEVHWTQAIDNCPGYPDYGGHEELHLGRLAPTVVEPVLQQTMRELGGGQDRSIFLPRLAEQIQRQTILDRFITGWLGYTLCTGPLWHLSGLLDHRVEKGAGKRRLEQIERHFETLGATWTRGADMDSRGPFWAALPRGGELRRPDQHDHRFLSLCPADYAPRAAAADFLVRSGVVCNPFVSAWLDLLKIGFWDILALKTCAFVVKRPLSARRDDRGRLHSAVGPALTWADGWSNYYLQGVSVPEQVVLCPDSLTVQQVLAQPNLEVRRIMVEQMGWARFVSSGQVMDADTDGSGLPRRLFHLADPAGGHEPVRLVHLACPSTHREYFLRVPPATQTCSQAVAWTFGHEPGDYHPVVET